MLVVIFSYNREEMLLSLLDELTDEDNPIETLIIDDGSEWSNRHSIHFRKMCSIIRTNHEGKQGFWKKWVMARQIALGSEHDYFLMIPDDISKLNLEAIKAITKQGWDDAVFAVNVINCGRTECWGHFNTAQMPIEVEGIRLDEVGFVDCGILTNRHTLMHIDIHEVGAEWFDRPDKSSGVGFQMTNSLRALGAVMMMPTPGLCYHGDHESQMHGEHRVKTPLTSKQ